MKKTTVNLSILIALSLALCACGYRYPSGLTEDLPFGLRHHMSKEEVLFILDSLIKQGVLDAHSQLPNWYSYELALDKPMHLSITTGFSNDSLFHISVRGEAQINNISNRENYRNAMAFLRSQGINLNAYSRKNDKERGEYIWSRDDKAYRITLRHNAPILMTFSDGFLGDRRGQPIDIREKFIYNLHPSDVYLNMEKQGFRTERQFSEEFGNTWTSRKRDANIEYRVEVYSSNVDSVETLSATATNLSLRDVSSSKPFFKFVASLLYENVNPDEATRWIEENFNNDRASTTITGVQFTIYAPTIAARMLMIEKVE